MTNPGLNPPVREEGSRHAIVFTAAGWATSALSAYGSAWLSTPAHNRIAANGATFDRCFVDSVRSREVLHSMWHALPAWQKQVNGSQNDEASSWIRSLSAANHRTICVTDDVDVAAAATNAGFNEVIVVELPHPLQMARTPDKTHLAQLIQSSIHTLQRSDPLPALVWIHTESLEQLWDAPESMRGQWFDDDELEPIQDILPPQLANDPPIDADELLRWIMCYADQISVCDQCLGTLYDAYLGLPGELRERCWFVVAGTSGIALGEHDWIGPKGGPALSPRTHVPLTIIGLGEPLRIAHLCQPSDIGFTLGSHLLGGSMPQAQARPRDLKQLVSPDQWMQRETDHLIIGVHDQTVTIQTGRWNWVSLPTGENQLFLKPDDRFDVNNIASRAESVCASFRTFYEHLQQTGSAAMESIVKFEG